MLSAAVLDLFAKLASNSLSDFLLSILAHRWYNILLIH